MTDMQRTGWAGWAAFAGVLLIVAGAIDALKGLTAVLLPSSSYFVVSDAGLLLFDAAGWGWWHLIIGLVLIVIGVFVLRGATWARVTAVIVVAINAISQIGLLGVQPWWSLAMIALDVVIIYALTVHGRELEHT